jgi:hypothetical protein
MHGSETFQIDRIHCPGQIKVFRHSPPQARERKSEPKRRGKVYVCRLLPHKFVKTKAVEYLAAENPSFGKQKEKQQH